MQNYRIGLFINVEAESADEVRRMADSAVEAAEQATPAKASCSRGEPVTTAPEGERTEVSQQFDAAAVC